MGAVLYPKHTNRKGLLRMVKGSHHRMVEFKILRRGNIKGQNSQGQLKWCCKQPDLVEDIPVHCRGFGLGALWWSLPTSIVLILDSKEGRKTQAVLAVSNDRIRSNGHKIKHMGFPPDITKHFFTF